MKLSNFVKILNYLFLSLEIYFEIELHYIFIIIRTQKIVDSLAQDRTQIVVTAKGYVRNFTLKRELKQTKFINITDYFSYFELILRRNFVIFLRD